MNYDKVWMEIYNDLIFAGWDTDEAEVEATERADEAKTEYLADRAFDQLKERD